MSALRMSSGVVIWALHFTAVYGVSAFACARGLGAAVPWVIVAASIAAAGAATAIIALHWSREFTRWMTAAIAGFALLAITWEALAALLTPTCV